MSLSCHVCGRQFTHSSSVRRHIHEIHTVVKPQFRCHICQKFFVRRLNLERHLQSHEHGTAVAEHVMPLMAVPVPPWGEQQSPVNQPGDKRKDNPSATVQGVRSVDNLVSLMYTTVATSAQSSVHRPPIDPTLSVPSIGPTGNGQNVAASKSVRLPRHPANTDTLEKSTADEQTDQPMDTTRQDELHCFEQKYRAESGSSAGDTSKAGTRKENFQEQIAALQKQNLDILMAANSKETEMKREITRLKIELSKQRNQLLNNHNMFLQLQGVLRMMESQQPLTAQLLSETPSANHNSVVSNYQTGLS